MARGDVLVAGDGIHSTVRSILFPQEGPPAAHLTYPMGSSGAGQAILDVTSLTHDLVRHADPTEGVEGV